MKETQQKAKWQVEKAAQEAVDVIAAAAKQAAQVIASAAATAIEVNNKKNAEGNNDHDLIIKLDTKMDAMQASIDKINDGTSAQMSDKETRIRRLELWGAISIGFIYAIQFYLLFVKH